MNNKDIMMFMMLFSVLVLTVLNCRLLSAIKTLLVLISGQL
jgi:hypothetical protein